MSEALSSTEIEDVLSSIRRLVSDDLRPTTRAAVAGQAEAAGDKLILTPALRVVVPEAVVADQTPAFVPRPRHVLMPDVAAPIAGAADLEQLGLDHVMASLGAAVDAQSIEWEAETGDLSPEFAEHLPLDDWNLPEPDAALRADAAVAENSMADDLPPASSLGAAQSFVFALARDVDEAILATTPPLPDSMPGWAQQDDSAAQDEDDVVYASAPTQGTLEPDLAWADAAEASVIAALSSDPAAPSAPDDANLPPEDEAMLFNEDVLRELVRDILREELAGKMGERITRNIRKLVRAEIARSLAAQEYE